MIADKVKADTIETWKAEIIEKEHIKEVLDKITEEIQKEKENIQFNLNEPKARWTNSGLYDGMTWAQEIIDKYREDGE